MKEGGLMINRTKLKKKFNDQGIQLPTKTINCLNDEITRIVDKWIRNTKRSNVKRLSENLLWCAYREGSYRES